jgi:hypothetical protein
MAIGGNMQARSARATSTLWSRLLEVSREFEGRLHDVTSAL